MQKGDEASPSIILAGQAFLVKMLIPLELCVAFGSTLHTYVFKHCPATGMQNGDEVSPSIIWQIKILITLGPHDIFCSNFVYLCILNIAQPLI